MLRLIYYDITATVCIEPKPSICARMCRSSCCAIQPSLCGALLVTIVQMRAPSTTKWNLRVLHVRNFVISCMNYQKLSYRTDTALRQLLHWPRSFKVTDVSTTDLYIFYPDAVPPIHVVSSHVTTDKDPSK